MLGWKRPEVPRLDHGPKLRAGEGRGRERVDQVEEEVKRPGMATAAVSRGRHMCVRSRQARGSGSIVDEEPRRAGLGASWSRPLPSSPVDRDFWKR